MEHTAKLKEAYIAMITKKMQKCDDLALLDLIDKILMKSMQEEQQEA